MDNTWESEIYADAISKIHFVNGKVKFELATLQPEIHDENDKPVMQEYAELTMEAPAFLRTFDACRDFVDHLASAGVIKKNDIPKVDE